MIRVEELETPVPVIALQRVEHNLAKMQAYCQQHNLRLRPHVKTHKQQFSFCLDAVTKGQIELPRAAVMIKVRGVEVW
ncbi:MAG: hypothetical protein ACREFO_19825 [Acetobacteraceae bacterium]